MNQAPRHPSIAAIRAMCVAATAAMAMTIAPSAAQGYTGEQVRYATETVNLTYEQFLARKSDFVNHGCEKPPWERRASDICNKPSPYNAFNWTTDGCSPPTPDSLKNLFNGPCQQHDFGYRNFGKGLTLGRSEDRRRWIDDQFQTQMKRLCDITFSDAWEILNRQACFKEGRSCCSRGLVRAR